MARKIAFLDTTVFLHYRSIEQIDWPTLLGEEKVILLVAAVVIRELNKHKDIHKSPTLRRRASSSLRTLDQFSDRESPVMIRDSVEIQFSLREPTLNFASYNLSREISDDYLLATVLECRNEVAGADVILITDDLGLKLKSRQHGIPTAKLPADLKLPEEVDPSQKRIKELEQKLHRTPELALMFEKGEGERKDRFRITLESSPTFTAANIEEQMEGVRQKYPKSKLEKSQEDTVVAVTLEPWSHVQADSTDHYNSELEKYYTRYKDYLVELRGYVSSGPRFVRLDISLENEGSCPAEDIDIVMHFPDGFQLVSNKEELPAPPSEPRPPERPKSLGEKITEQLRSARPVTNYANIVNSIQTLPAEPQNVSRPYIRRLNSYTVDVRVQMLKHKLLERLHPLYVVFDSVYDARSFSVDYVLYVANVPDEVRGTLHVIIEVP